MTEENDKGLCPVRVNIAGLHCRRGVSIFRLGLLKVQRNKVTTAGIGTVYVKAVTISVCPQQMGFRNLWSL